MSRLLAATLFVLAFAAPAKAQFCFGPVGFAGFGYRAGFGFAFGGPHGAAFGFRGGWGYRWHSAWAPGFWGWPVVVAPPPVVVVQQPVVVVNAGANFEAAPPNLDDLLSEKTGRPPKEYTIIRPTGAEFVSPHFERVQPLPKAPTASRAWRAAVGMTRPQQPVSATAAGALAEPGADFDQLLNLAQEAFAAGQYGRSVERSAEAMKQRPADPLAFLLKAQADFARGKYRDAAAALNEGLSLRPDWLAVGVRIADLYDPLPGHWAADVEALGEAAAASPDNASLQFLLGYQLWLRGDWKPDDPAVAQFLREAERIK